MPRIILYAFVLVTCAALTRSAKAQPAPPTPSPQLFGILQSIEVKPNKPGARCGNHYELRVAGTDRKIIVVTINDMRASSKDLYAMEGREVEVDLAGSAVLGIRLASGQKPEVAALSGLSARRPC
jgi:hypothetical protein